MTRNQRDVDFCPDGQQHEWMTDESVKSYTTDQRFVCRNCGKKMSIDSSD